MRNLPQERLIRSQHEYRKEIKYRLTLWVIVVLGVTHALTELVTHI